MFTGCSISLVAKRIREGLHHFHLVSTYSEAKTWQKKHVLSAFRRNIEHFVKYVIFSLLVIVLHLNLYLIIFISLKLFTFSSNFLLIERRSCFKSVKLPHCSKYSSNHQGCSKYLYLPLWIVPHGSH